MRSISLVRYKCDEKFELGASRLLETALRVPGVRGFRSRLTSAADLLAVKKRDELTERYFAFTGTGKDLSVQSLT